MFAAEDWMDIAKVLFSYGAMGVFSFFGLVIMAIFARWLMRRGDQLIDRHIKFIDGLEVAIAEIRECGQKTSDSMIDLGKTMNSHAERENGFMEKISECQIKLADAAQKAVAHA